MLVCALAFVLGFASCAKDSNDSNGGNSGTNPFLGSWVSSEKLEADDYDCYLKLVFNEYNVGGYMSYDGATWNYVTTTSYTWSGNSMQMNASDGMEGWSGTVSGGTLTISGGLQLFKQ